MFLVQNDSRAISGSSSFSSDNSTVWFGHCSWTLSLESGSLDLQWSSKLPIIFLSKTPFLFNSPRIIFSCL